MAAGGQPELLRVGGLPQGEDFGNAARVVGNGDATPAVEGKLATLYEQKGLHPAEVAHDAAHDVTITQSLLSSDKKDMPYGASGETFKGEPLPMAGLAPAMEAHDGTIYVGRRNGQHFEISEAHPVAERGEGWKEGTSRRTVIFSTGNKRSIGLIRTVKENLFSHIGDELDALDYREQDVAC